MMVGFVFGFIVGGIIAYALASKKFRYLLERDLKRAEQRLIHDAKHSDKK